jgi:hypothetical protein
MGLLCTENGYRLYPNSDSCVCCTLNGIHHLLLYADDVILLGYNLDAIKGKYGNFN